MCLSEDQHYYNVPYELIGKKLNMQYSKSKVELYQKYELIVSHKRLRSPHNYSIEPTHMPNNTAMLPNGALHFFLEKAQDIRKLNRATQRAHFRYKANVEQIAFDDNMVDKNQVLCLADFEIIKCKENIIITGSTGIGKSYLASAICHQACSLGYAHLKLMLP